MDCKTVGVTIAKLRKQNNMTQSELAQRLEVSDKAVSKWENGLGFPDTTVFPLLASLFNVSIDYLMLGEKKQIAVAGNILADIVKDIDAYPALGMLSSITQITKAVGGCVPNVAINLKKIDQSIPVVPFGKIGTDEYGRFLLSQLQKYGLSTDQITVSETAPTSFSDVMSLATGERTFFHQRGANAEFNPSEIDLSKLNCSILHIGYLLLLDVFDQEDSEFGTVMARFLASVQSQNIKTSIDVVSSSTGDFSKKVIPALKYCNYVIINETECCSIWDLPAYTSDGILIEKNIKAAMFNMVNCGVKEKIVIHAKKKAFCLDVKSGEFTKINSLKIPSEEIKGSVGAGDAFCAGILYGLYNDFSDMQLLEFASTAAACNLFSANSVDGMKSKNEIYQIMKKYPRLTE